MHALVTADTVGGVWTYARELVTGLVRRGVRVTLVSFGNIPGPEQLEWMSELSPKQRLPGTPQPDGLDYRPTGFRLEWMQESERDLAQSAEYLRAVVDEVQPDLVHLNQYGYGSLAFGVPKLVVAHSDVVSWWVAVHGEEPPANAWTRWYRETVSRGLADADVVVAPSRWMMDAVHRHYGKPTREQVIHNGRTPALFDPVRAKSPWAMSVGRLWDQGKQVSLLTRTEPAMPIVIAGVERHPEAPSGDRGAGSLNPTSSTQVSTPASATGALAGAPRCSDSANPKHASSAVTGAPGTNLEFKGQLRESQLRGLYGEASVYVATSCYEPFGLAPVEAALSRCALVVNDIPSFRELWGDAAYYFATNDSVTLSSALRRMASDREFRISYAKLAYDRACRYFTAERMVDAYLKLYEALLAAEVAAR